MNPFGFFRKFVQTPATYVWIALAISLGFGLSNISEFITADEHYWLPNYGSERLQEYWRAVSERDWDDTRINDKPGITLAYVSGIAIPFAGDLIDRQILSDDGIAKVFDPEVTKRINILFRTPLFLFNSLFVAFYIYWILRKVTENDRVSAWAVILMLLSPVLLGLNQVVNPDTLFWTLGSATILTYLALLKTRERRYAILTAILFGLTLASKYVAIIFFSFFFLLIPLDYLYRFDEYAADRKRFVSIMLGDLRRFFAIGIAAIAVFCLLMPAAITDTEELFGGDEAFDLRETFPMFGAILAAAAALMLDAALNRGRATLAVIRRITPHRAVIERTLYAILLATTLFVLFNWVLKNSIYDLSDIPFDAKTKESFTTENPFLVRFIVEFVPLVFALTPLTLFLLIYAWTHSLLSSFRDRFLILSISIFFLLFYLAVISQGLLVTVRYSIILFPLALILGAYSLESIIGRKKKRSWLPHVYAGIFWMLGISIALTEYHASVPVEDKIAIENFIGSHLILAGTVALAIDILLVAATLRVLRLPIFSRIPYPLIAVAVIATSTFSLALARPHTFIYVNDLLPDRYLISGAWGYGGYEAAEYLNAKPDAKSLTIWTDSHGVCEFFVGSCIHRSKLDTGKYPVDYLFFSLRGQLRPKFDYVSDNVEWDYAVGGRKKNFIKLFHNVPRESVILEP